MKFDLLTNMTLFGVSNAKCWNPSKQLCSKINVYGVTGKTKGSLQTEVVGWHWPIHYVDKSLDILCNNSGSLWWSLVPLHCRWFWDFIVLSIKVFQKTWWRTRNPYSLNNRIFGRSPRRHDLPVESPASVRVH